MGPNTSSLHAGRWSPLVIVGLVLVLAVSASAEQIPWDPPEGANARFGWFDGKSDDADLGEGGLWGQPTVPVAGFLFEDMNPLFRAVATPTQSDAIASVMKVSIDTNDADPAPADPLTELHVHEWGSFTGDVADLTGTYGTLLIIPTNPGAPAYWPYQVSLTFEFDTEAYTWEAWADVIFANTPPTFPSEAIGITIDVTNHLQVAPGSSSIQKLGAEITVPEPTALMLLLCGLVPVVSRRASVSRRRV